VSLVVSEAEGTITARYGLVLPDAAREVRKRVANTLVATCGVGIAIVDVSIEEVE
jgi:uncharacterized alkaline shock family protein YloU